MRKQKANWSEPIKHMKQEAADKMTDTMKLPKDMVYGACIVTLTGNLEAWIENYRGILEYSDTCILLQGKKNRICLEGTKLSIDYYTNEDMKISGHISSVRYL